MKYNHTVLFTALFSLVLCSATASAMTWRQDVGMYTSDKFDMGGTEVEFANGGKVKTVYTAATFSHMLSDESSVSLGIEWVQMTMDGFTMAGTPDGGVQSGLSKINVDFKRQAWQQGDMNAGYHFGIEAPGDTSQSPYSFNSIDDGVTSYKLGGDFSTSFFREFSFIAALTYVYRPGKMSDGTGFVEIPDRYLLDISLPYSFGSHVVGLSVGMQKSQGGAEINKTDWNNVKTANGGPPFPITKEEATVVGLFYGTSFGEHWVDFTVSQKDGTANNDSGMGFNLGYEREF